MDEAPPLFLSTTTKAMHLVRDTDRLDILAFHLRLAHGTFHSDLHVRPPILRILLRPPRTQRLDRGLFFGIKIRTYC